ncbi:MAG: hypothetical protein WC178_01235 [Candidatus Paceibacterota bacterium]
MLSNLKSFQGLRKEIASELIKDKDTRGAIVVFENFGSFEEGDRDDIVFELIEAGWAASMADCLQGLGKNIALKLIEKKQGWVVAKYLSSFEGVDKEIVEKVLGDMDNWEEDVKNNPSMSEDLEKMKESVGL